MSGYFTPSDSRAVVHDVACTLGFSTLGLLYANLPVRMLFPGTPSMSVCPVTPPFPSACLPNSARPAHATTPVSAPLSVSLGSPPPAVTPLGDVGMALRSVCLSLSAYVVQRLPPRHSSARHHSGRRGRVRLRSPLSDACGRFVRAQSRVCIG